LNKLRWQQGMVQRKSSLTQPLRPVPAAKFALSQAGGGRNLIDQSSLPAS
jgi:hypothetical protein